MKKPFDRFFDFFFRFSVQKTEIMEMTKNLSLMLEAGMTIAEALEIISLETTGSFQRVMTDVSQRVHMGESFGDAMQQSYHAFDPVIITAIRVGEQTGTLAKNVAHVADQLEREALLRHHIHSAMLYPIIVVCATALLGMVLATFILPQLVGVFVSLRIELPLSTKILLILADFFRVNGGFVFLTFLLGIPALLILSRQKRVKSILDRVFLRIPIIKDLLHDMNRARLARSLATMLASGVPIQEALETLSSTLSNAVYQASVKALTMKIQSGQTFSDLLADDAALYPKMMQRMLSVAERSGNLSHALQFIARYYEQRVKSKSKNLATILEPVLLLGVGLVVAFLASAIFTPIYSVTEGLSL